MNCDFYGLFGLFGVLVIFDDFVIYGHFWPSWVFGLLRSAVCGLWGLLEVPRTKMEPPGPILLGTQGDQGAQKWPIPKFHHIWPGPIEGVQDHQDLGLPQSCRGGPG